MVKKASPSFSFYSLLLPKVSGVSLSNPSYHQPFDLIHLRLPSCTLEIVSPGDSCHNDSTAIMAENANNWSPQRCHFPGAGGVFRRCGRATITVALQENPQNFI